MLNKYNKINICIIVILYYFYRTFQKNEVKSILGDLKMDNEKNGCPRITFGSQKT